MFVYETNVKRPIRLSGYYENKNAHWLYSSSLTFSIRINPNAIKTPRTPMPIKTAHSKVITKFVGSRTPPTVSTSYPSARTCFMNENIDKSAIAIDIIGLFRIVIAESSVDAEDI